MSLIAGTPLGGFFTGPDSSQVESKSRARHPQEILGTGTALDAMRDETAAYPADRGPRITYLVETNAGQASLVFDGRRRRWFVDALDEAA